MIEAKRWVEPCGEECGTIYDESNACKYCGSQERQASDLILDAGSLPKSGSLALAMTIGRETIVSEAFVRLFESNVFSGAFFGPIKTKGRASRTIADWSQLIVKSSDFDIVPPTRVWLNPFEDGTEHYPEKPHSELLAGMGIEMEIEGSWCDRTRTFRCPLGHTIGLNLVSELFVQRRNGQTCDIECTRQRIGVRRGVLRPSKIMVVSPRFRQSFLDRGLKGIDFEPVHLVSAE